MRFFRLQRTKVIYRIENFNYLLFVPTFTWKTRFQWLWAFQGSSALIPPLLSLALFDSQLALKIYVVVLHLILRVMNCQSKSILTSHRSKSGRFTSIYSTQNCAFLHHRILSYDCKLYRVYIVWFISIEF